MYSVIQETVKKKKKKKKNVLKFRDKNHEFEFKIK